MTQRQRKHTLWVFFGGNGRDVQVFEQTGNNKRQLTSCLLTPGPKHGCVTGCTICEVLRHLRETVVPVSFPSAPKTRFLMSKPTSSSVGGDEMSFLDLSPFSPGRTSIYTPIKNYRPSERYGCIKTTHDLLTFLDYRPALSLQDKSQCSKLNIFIPL